MKPSAVTILIAVLALLVVGPQARSADDAVPEMAPTVDELSRCTTDECCESCDGCCDTCGCGRGCCCGGKLLGVFAPSDPCYSDFISPMTNPVNFEDPRTLTEARLIFLNHWLPPELAGDCVQLYALQLRAALTDRLSVIATKDGYIVSQSTLPVLDDGWADVAAGLKYNLFSNPWRGRILSAGVTYELPSGSRSALQGNGDGEFHMFLTGGARALGGHWLSAAAV